MRWPGLITLAVRMWLLSPSQHALAHELETAEDAGVSELATQRNAPSLSTVVRGRRVTNSASSTTVRSEDFGTRSLRGASDLLEVTPGLVTLQQGSGGKASQFFLRGFDVDHGTDLAISVDGVPVNLVSHGHGHGYADLHFVIPETVEKVEVVKGPYAAEYGDFATAGAANLHSRRSFEKSSVSVSLGNFDTFRALGIVAPKWGDRWNAFVVGEAFASNGPFESPEKLKRYNLQTRVSFLPTPRTELTLQAGAYASGWNSPGLIPERSVLSGALGRFGSIDRTDGGDSQRQWASFHAHHHSLTGDEIRLLGYWVRSKFDLFSNFTFVAQDSEFGDQIEQTDARNVFGAEVTALKRLTWKGLDFRTRAGLRLRVDELDVGLSTSAKRIRLGDRMSSHVTEGTVGLFVSEEVQWVSWFRSILGARIDALGTRVQDRLQPGERSAQAALVSPKASLVLSPVAWADVFFNFGRGFHSNDARGIVREVDPAQPLVPATGLEVGVRARPAQAIDVALVGWALDLDSETVWVGDEGTTEARSATRRRGVEAELRWKIAPGLRAEADVTWSHARFVEPVESGTAIPLAPVWTWSAGLRYEHSRGVFANLRAQGLSNRPATEDGALIAEGFSLVDAEVGFRADTFRIAVEVTNLLNARWRETQFAFDSRLPTEPNAVRDVHFTSGAPTRVMATLGLTFQ